MNDIIDVPAKFNEEPPNNKRHAPSTRMQTLTTIGWVSYALHFVVAVAAVLPGTEVGIGLLIVAVILDWVKKDDAKGSWQESHFTWRIRSVLWSAVWYVVTSPLFLLLYLPGKLAWTAVSVWFLYRIVRGMVNMQAQRAVGQ